MSEENVTLENIKAYKKAISLLFTFADENGVSVKALAGPRGPRMLSDVRHDCYAHLRRNTELSFSDIGVLLGNRDHTTVMHGVKVSEARA